MYVLIPFTGTKQNMKQFKYCLHLNCSSLILFFFWKSVKYLQWDTCCWEMGSLAYLLFMSFKVVRVSNLDLTRTSSQPERAVITCSPSVGH